MSWLPVSARSAERVTTGQVLGLTAVTSATLASGTVPAAEELEIWKWDQYQLETDMAAKLGITVGGGGNLGQKSRVLVGEFSRSTTVENSTGPVRYGVAARMVVKITNFNAGINLTLPFVAAEAQQNRLEASCSLQIEGYVGAAAKSLPDFASFNVETYVKIQDALTTLKNKIGDDTANIRPVQLWVWTDDSEDDVSLDERLTRAVGTAWALTQITSGSGVTEAEALYADGDDEVAKAAIRSTYMDLGADGANGPDAQTRVRARELLDGYRARQSWFQTG